MFYVIFYLSSLIIVFNQKLWSKDLKACEAVVLTDTIFREKQKRPVWHAVIVHSIMWFHSAAESYINTVWQTTVGRAHNSKLALKETDFAIVIKWRPCDTRTDLITFSALRKWIWNLQESSQFKSSFVSRQTTTQMLWTLQNHKKHQHRIKHENSWFLF